MTAKIPDKMGMSRNIARPYDSTLARIATNGRLTAEVASPDSQAE
ncbi:hypothetical protein SH668x_002867 [Planctomicrobium sp. SH668]